MALAVGSRLGPYEVLATLGEREARAASALNDERRRLHLVTGWLEELRRLVPAGGKP